MVTALLVAAGAGTSLALVRAARRAPVVHRSAALSRRRPRLLPDPVREPIRRALARADLDVPPEEAVRSWLVVTGSATTAALLVDPALAAPVGVAGLLAGPTGLHLARRRRERRVRAAIPDLLERVARELRAGNTVAGAVERLAREPGLVGGELARVAGRARLGLGLSASLAAWVADHEGTEAAADVRTAAAALGVATAAGGRSAGALEDTAAALRDHHSVAAEARALAAQGRMSALVVGCLPLVSLVGSVGLGGDPARVLVATSAGRLALLTGLALNLAAALWMRRIVRVEP